MAHSKTTPNPLSPARFDEIVSRYRDLAIGLVGDISLDRYLEIDPAKKETSIETGLEVRNVVRVRSQPGSAGTILNNLSALGVGKILPVAFAGEDGEGFELARAVKEVDGADMKHFFFSEAIRTFTYTKPLVIEPGMPPQELNRLDFKNWKPTPADIEDRIIDALKALIEECDALMLMDQVEVQGSGVLTDKVLKSINSLLPRFNKWTMADSRHGLSRFPACVWKMNANELRMLAGESEDVSGAMLGGLAVNLAFKNQNPVFVTLAEEGMLCAQPGGGLHQSPAFPVEPPIDVVGAGDAVSANLIAALSAGAREHEAMQIAMAAASVVIHQLGTTGTASPAQIATVLYGKGG